MKQILSIIMLTCFFTACNNGPSKEVEMQMKKQATIDSLKAVVVKQKAIDSVNARAAKVAQATDNSNDETTTAKKKKGWSNTAKGAVIGAGAGAVAGAIIDKRHGEGAIVGGIIGAAAGTVTGAAIDEKKKKKKAVK